MAGNRNNHGNGIPKWAEDMLYRLEAMIERADASIKLQKEELKRHDAELKRHDEEFKRHCERSEEEHSKFRAFAAMLDRDHMKIVEILNSIEKRCDIAEKRLEKLERLHGRN